MTTMQEILTSARRKVITSSHVTPLIGVDIGKDQTGAFTDGWIFLGHDDWNTPERNPSNTGKASVTLSMRNPWTTPSMHNTAKFRLLRVHIMADMSRPTDTRLTGTKDAEFRCDRIASAIVKELHDVANKDHLWPNGVFVISCVQFTELAIVDVNDQDGLVSGDLTFALTLD